MFLPLNISGVGFYREASVPLPLTTFSAPLQEFAYVAVSRVKNFA